MRVLVCGDRNWADRDYIFRVLDEIHSENPISLVVEGEAPGADTMGREWAESRGVPVDPYPALWKKYGKAAGPIRNKQMLVEGQPQHVVAFHPHIEVSRGTGNMIRQAREAGVPFRVYEGVNR